MALVPLSEPPLVDVRALYTRRPALGRIASGWAAHLDHLAGAQLITAQTHIVDTDDAIVEASQNVQVRVQCAGLCTYLWVRVAYQAFAHVGSPSIGISSTADAGWTWTAPATLPVASEEQFTAWTRSAGNVAPLTVSTPWTFDAAAPAVPRLLKATALSTQTIYLAATDVRLHAVTVIQAYRESV